MLASRTNEQGVLDLLKRHAVPGVLLDVGAYHGAFSKSAMATGLFSGVVLFEPNPENIVVLDEAFHASERATIIPKAVGSTKGRRVFRFGTDLTTGSLLPYVDQPATAKAFDVEVVSLDSMIFDTAISVIKIDTQGGDLDVLRGASNLIAAHAPVIVAELIFAGLYEGQADPFEVMQWLVARGYAMAGFYNEHYGNGWLSFADAIFISQSRAPQVPASFDAVLEPNALMDEIDMLRRVCDERLDLINRLDRDLRRATGVPFGD